MAEPSIPKKMICILIGLRLLEFSCNYKKHFSLLLMLLKGFGDGGRAFWMVFGVKRKLVLPPPPKRFPFQVKKNLKTQLSS